MSWDGDEVDTKVEGKGQSEKSPHRLAVTRPSWDEYFLNIAEAVAARSHDAETKVGCVIVDAEHRVLATGYNGYPPGYNDELLPNIRPYKYKYMVHAEMNAIASSRADLRGGTLYCTSTPCNDCAKAIVTAGIKRVVCAKAYSMHDGVAAEALDLLRMGGVEVVVGLPVESVG
jgi:dCMP deaminase